MNYHLQREGHPVEVTTLERLRLRREANELDGRELVWREGMSEWQWLDTVLDADAAHLPRNTPPPIPESVRRKRSRVWGPVIALIVVAGLVQLVWVGYQGVTAYRTIRSGMGLHDSDDGVAIARQPVIVTTNSRTQTDFNRQAREFRVRQYLRGYQERGERHPQIDAQAVQLIEAWIAFHFGGERNTNSNSADELGERLAADSRCTDPLLLTVLAANSTGSAKRQLLEKALASYPRSQHRAYPKLYATVSLGTALGSANARSADLDASAVELFRQGFRDGSFVSGDQAELAEAFLYSWGSSFFKRNAGAILEIVQGAGKEFDWLALVLEGEDHIAQAWRARGGGYADSVSAAGWQAFSSHLGLAREALTEAWKRRPDLPQAPARLIYVSLGDADLAEMRRWFDHTLEAQIDYDQAWSSLRWGMRPRWYGSHEALRELGVTAIKTGRFDLDVPRKFLDSVADIESELELDPGEHIYGQEDIWPWIAQLYEGYIRQHGSSRQADWWRSLYVAVAYLADRPETARAQLEALKWEPQSGAFANWGRDMSLLPLEIAARTGALQNEINGAEANRENGNILEALKDYQKLAFASGADERTRRFIQSRNATLEIEQALAAGDWVDFLPRNTADAAWITAFGRAETQANGSLEVLSGEQGHLLYSLARVGSEFELKGEFENPRKSPGGFQAGLVFGLPNPHDQAWFGLRFQKEPNASEMASLAYGGASPSIRRKVSFRPGPNEFLVRFQNGRVKLLINGNEVMRAVRMSRVLPVRPQDVLVGFGGAGCEGEPVIRYDRIQVRRLKDGSAPPREADEAPMAE